MAIHKYACPSLATPGTPSACLCTMDAPLWGLATTCRTSASWMCLAGRSCRCVRKKGVTLSHAHFMRLHCSHIATQPRCRATNILWRGRSQCMLLARVRSSALSSHPCPLGCTTLLVTVHGDGDARAEQSSACASHPCPKMHYTADHSAQGMRLLQHCSAFAKVIPVPKCTILLITAHMGCDCCSIAQPLQVILLDA
eukprot:1144964-Pelagomonas_calceolata.AAC.2